MNEAIEEILANGFKLEIFRLWKIERVEPWVYVRIESNDLREKPEFNSRTLKGDTLAEALAKAVNVSRYIISVSKPI